MRGPVTTRVFLSFREGMDVTPTFQQNGWIYDLRTARAVKGVVYGRYYVRGYNGPL